jgi:hypothetical protein
MTRFMQVVLFINIALAALLDGIGGHILHVGPDGRIGALEPIVSRQYAAVSLAFAVVLLFIVLRRFQSDPAWLLVPAAFLSALWLDAVYELAAGTGPSPISDYLPPIIIRTFLVACYVAGYVTLRRAARERGFSAAQEGKGGAAATD